MKYKMSELVKLSQIPKSTILYYIKEGLLPNAEKLKTNVHLYNSEHLELLKYIKYMQQEFNCSISKLKEILENKNTSFSTSTLMLMPLLESLIGSNKDEYTKNELLIKSSISGKELNNLIKEEIIIPIDENKFSDKDLSILKLIQKFNEIGISTKILKDYVKYSKELAKLNSKLQKDLCKVRSDENFSTLWHIQLETIFNAKEYIFNRHTYREFMNNLKEEVKES